MPRRRMDTRTIREILRLDSRNFSTTKISQSVNKARSSVNDIVRKARNAGVKWPVDIDDRKLEEMLYSKPEAIREGKAEPDWSSLNFH